MTITATKGSVTVKTTLYGEVSPERASAEQKIAQHRAEMLS